MSAGKTVLRCGALCKRFGGVAALDHVDLEVRRGSVHALLGENGAGKSTLIKILSGALRADSGQVEIDGRPVDIRNPRQAWAHGIAAVHQEFNLVGDLSVAENVLLGRWPRRLPGVVDFAELQRRAQGFLELLGLDLPPRRPVRSLTIAQQQLVEIAKALAIDARVLILDEPSAVLTHRELAALFHIVRTLQQRGVAVIYISHRLEEVFELADRVTVLRDGRHIATRDVAGAERAGLIFEMVGRPLSTEFPPRTATQGGVVLSVEGLTVPGRFADVGFEVRAGEVLALAGLVGSGRSSVVKTLFGAVRAARGRVRVGAAEGPFHSPRSAMAAGIACVPEDRKHEGLLLERSVTDNITLAGLWDCAYFGVLDARRERRVAESLMRDLRIKAAGPTAAVRTLSGGNQQKVLVARWLSRPHRVMLFDEPTRGIDVGAKQEMYALINRLAEQGAAVVMVSSELPEVLGMADRIAVMRNGRLAGILDNRLRRATQEQVMDLASG